MKTCKGYLYLLSACLTSAVCASFNSIPGDQIIIDQQSPITGISHGPELASLSSNQFSVFSHLAFPGRSARIKKSSFCDGEVDAYTGYIDVGTRHTFFSFFESRNNPDTDDVMLWTNGGPGGSSLLGMLMELGPCMIQDENSTRYNPYSWNAHANIFFIDQPVGVGFSYADYGETVGSTEESAKDIAAFIAMFFESFPKFKGRAFHLSGESYAGRYLPVYATEIYDQNTKLAEKGIAPINLNSILIGNGATNFFHLVYSWYDIACTSAALHPVLPVKSCVRMKQILPRCKKGIQEKCIDHWDQIDCEAAFMFCLTETGVPYEESGLNPYDITKKCYKGHALCYIESEYIEKYLNQPWVRKEIGADPISGNFTAFSPDVQKLFFDAGDPLHLTETYVSELLEHGVRVLIYAGTYDWVGNWVANERWTLEMDWTGQEGFRSQTLTDWLVDGKAAGQQRTFGILTFATIYAAGHMAPFDKPAESLELIKRWTSGKDL